MIWVFTYEEKCIAYLLGGSEGGKTVAHLDTLLREHSQKGRKTAEERA
jgi:hypothetical protein